MRPNPYVHERLPTTRDSRVEPGTLVDLWVDALSDILEGRSPVEGGSEAYDLLAGCARLRRTCPELVEQIDTHGVFAQAEGRIATGGRDLAALALHVPNPAGWREEGEQKAAALEELADPVQRARLARELITDLDDAELALYAAAQQGFHDAELDGELSDCRQWLASHAGIFLSAGAFIQAMGMTIRPDLPEFDPPLAATAEKFVRFLEELEAAEDEFEFAGQPPLDRRELDALLARFIAERQQPASAASLPLEPWRWPETAYQVAASTEKDQRRQPVYRWTSPGGALTARLAVPPTFRATNEEGLCIAFQRMDESRTPATELAGTRAALAGVDSKIDEQGLAFFAVGEFRRQNVTGLHLEVGNPPVVWRIEEPEAK